MKRLALVLLCIMLTGCQAITFSVDGLLSAPKVADEQSAIYEALFESAGRGITLEYPRSGDYRSAFVLYDIDGDREEETLAFYSVNSVSESNVKISVLDSGEDGRWRSTYEVAGAGSSVDKIMFSGRDLIVGYSSQDYEDNAVRIYRYSDGMLEPIYEDTYSVLEKADLDGCGTEETLVVKRSGGGIAVDLLKPSESEVYSHYFTEIPLGAGTIAGFGFSEFDGVNALYLDFALESYGILTEIIYLDDGIVAAMSQSGLLYQTQRPTGYLSRDYDGDGLIEIPLPQPFTGYELSPFGEAEYMTVFCSFDPEQMLLVPKSNAYLSLGESYCFNIPNRWMNMVTVARDASTGETTFYKYDPSLGGAENMTPLISFASAESSAASAYESAGYTEIAETDFRTYYVNIIAGSDEPMVLTMDEIRDNFHIIE